MQTILLLAAAVLTVAAVMAALLVAIVIVHERQWRNIKVDRFDWSGAGTGQEKKATAPEENKP